MARLIRKQVYIAARHERALKRLSKERGVPEAELIREGIERVAAAPARRGDDKSWWEREQRFIRRRLTLEVPQTGRAWTREELYKERLGPRSR